MASSQYYEYEVVLYHYDNGKWLDERNLSAPVYVNNKLNRLYPEVIEVKIGDPDELKALYRRAIESDNYSLALNVCKKGLNQGIDVARTFLPMISSVYRKMNMPQSALDVSNEYYKKYGSEVLSAALYTSNGAAYADMGQYDKANKMASKAYAMSGGKASPELSALYGRIQKEMRGD